jgi:diacylglycerol O-acyltransferase / wax synthase
MSVLLRPACVASARWGRTRRRARIDRASPNDLMVLATDIGSVPMQVGAILVLDPCQSPTPAAVRAAIEERIRSLPRLRQHLVGTPMGGGRPAWVDDREFDIGRHVRSISCPAPGDEHALLGVAARMVMDRLPMDRPLWSATFVTDLANGAAALVFVFHHVLADGIGGLAVLARLADGGSGLQRDDFPQPGPARSELFLDALVSRICAVTHLGSGLSHVRGAVAELRPGGTPVAYRSSLNRPTGPRRQLAVVRTPLNAVHDVAHAHAGTVNDVVLTAVAGALRVVLDRRGEAIDELVVSVPVSGRDAAGGVRLGNETGVIPVSVPTIGDPLQRLEAIASITRRRKKAPRGSSAALLGPVFRALARLGAFQWFIDHQRLVNTFVTNLRGPESRVFFLGAAVSEVIPVSLAMGNVTVAFAVLSYAGSLTVTVVADPDRCPDLPVLVQELQLQFDTLSGAATRDLG